MFAAFLGTSFMLETYLRLDFFLSVRGLPPSAPFLRDDAALGFERTEPRHAGQKEIRSILWT